MKIYISHASNFDYEAELYGPIKRSTLGTRHQFFLPHDAANETIRTKDIMASYDLMFAEVSNTSTGQGIEIGLAAAFDVPIVGLVRTGTTPASASLRFYVSNIMEYATDEQLIAAITASLAAKTQQG